MEQAGPSSAPLAGAFLYLSLDLASDQLYDLAPEIPDVMGLRSEAIVKVMSLPDSRCIRVVAPDDHVNIGFNELLLHDIEEEDIPFVALSELNCLRQSCPKPLFVFMSRYQHDLERMRKEVKEWFGCTQSGNWAHCGKYKQNLGKHITLFHVELAQLCRCPVTWCTVWKGTAQDCVDHLRQTHEISHAVKAANLARYFPPWTVMRSQWSEMTKPAICGVAIEVHVPWAKSTDSPALPATSRLDTIVRLFLGISQSFVPQIVFTKPEIYILFSIFWTVRKSRLSQTSDCSR